MKYYNSLADFVGNTPLVRINRIIRSSNLVLAKMEQYNPCGSVKDRPALNMIEDAVNKNILKKGGTIIEATSGNTGIALSFVGILKGFRTLIVMPESMSRERQKLFKLLGAEVELTQAHLGMQGAIDRARELNESIENSLWVDQFSNPANVEIHEKTTAVEIIEDTEGKVDILVAGVGTGGTITGVGKRLKKIKPDVRVIGVEPLGSSVLNGGSAGPHLIQGLGPGFVPPILDMDVIDRVECVSDEESLAWSSSLMRKEGMISGISSGAVMCAVDRYIRENNIENSTIVGILPDTGERYLSLPMFTGK